MGQIRATAWPCPTTRQQGQDFATQMHLRVSTFSGLCGGAWFCLLVIKKNRSPKTQPDTLTKKASTSLSLRKPAFAFDSFQPKTQPTTGKVPATVRARSAFAKSTVLTPARQSKRARPPASFAGTDGFAYFCHNKSRSPKAKRSILYTTGLRHRSASATASPRAAIAPACYDGALLPAAKDGPPC